MRFAQASLEKTLSQEAKHVLTDADAEIFV